MLHKKFLRNLINPHTIVPSGVATSNDFTPPEVEGPHTATYTFSAELFDDSNGEILYYAIILGKYGQHETPTANTWRGTEDSWPLVPGITNDSYTFQATPKMWNPFQQSIIIIITVKCNHF